MGEVIYASGVLAGLAVGKYTYQERVRVQDKNDGTLNGAKENLEFCTSIC